MSGLKGFIDTNGVLSILVPRDNLKGDIFLIKECVNCGRACKDSCVAFRGPYKVEGGYKELKLCDQVGHLLFSDLKDRRVR